MFTIRPSSSKMYQNLKKDYWWPSMKKNITECVDECVVSQQVMFEHQRPCGLYHQFLSGNGIVLLCNLKRDYCILRVGTIQSG